MNVSLTDVELRQRRKTHSRSPSKQMEMLGSEPKARLTAHFQKHIFFDLGVIFIKKYHNQLVHSFQISNALTLLHEYQ